MGPPILMTRENKSFQNKMMLSTDRQNSLPVRQIDFYGSKVGRNVKAKVDSWRIKPPSEDWKISSPSFRQEQKQKKPKTPVENFQLSPFKTAKMLEEINLLMTIRQVDKNLKSSTTYLKSVQRALNKNFKKSESLKNIKRKSSELEINKEDYKEKTKKIEFKPQISDIKPELDLKPEKDENSKVKTLMSFWNEQFSNRPMTVCIEPKITEKRDSPIPEPTLNCVEEEHTLKPSEFKNVKKVNIVEAIKMNTNIRKTTSLSSIPSKLELKPILKSIKPRFPQELKPIKKDEKKIQNKQSPYLSSLIQYEGLNWNFVLQPGIFRPMPNFEVLTEPYGQDINFEQYFSLRDYRLSKKQKEDRILFKIRENLERTRIDVVEYFKYILRQLDEKLKIKHFAVALIISLLTACFYIF